MAKITMECPRCSYPLQVSTGLFAKSKITCPQCKKEIDIATEKMVTEDCPKCGNKVTYDVTKPSSAICPACRTNIKAIQTEDVSCPSCNHVINVNKNAKTCVCPQCKVTFDVQARLAQKESGKTAQVVQWNGERDVVIYRHPMENFKLGSQLIVREGHKAIFLRDGRAVGVFGPGRYTLETQNLPLLKDILKLPTDSNATFTSQVYFVKTEGVIALKWNIPYTNILCPGMDFYVRIGAVGEANLKIIEGNENARKFLSSVIGEAFSEGNVVSATEKYDSKFLANKFKSFISARLGSLLTDIIVSNNLNVLDLAPKRAKIGDMLMDEFNKLLDQYGLVIPPMNFMLVNIDAESTPELEEWKRQVSDKVLKVRAEEVLTAEAQARQKRVLVEDQTEVQRKILKTQGESEERRITAQADADVTRLTAQGESDAELIRSKAQTTITADEANRARISAQGAADASIISGTAEAELARIGAQGVADASIISSKAQTTIVTDEAERKRIATQGDADASIITSKARTTTITDEAEQRRIFAQGEADASVIAGKADAELTRVGAQGDVDASIITSGAKTTLATDEVASRKIFAEGDAEVARTSAYGEADVTRISAQAEADASVITSGIKATLASDTAEETRILSHADAEADITLSRAEAERIRVTGQASAQAYSAQALAEAEEMHAKGYTYESETARELGKEALKNGLPGTGNGGGGGHINSTSNQVSSAIGDMIGLGVTLNAMGSVANMTKDIVNPIMGQISDIGKTATGATPPQATMLGAWNCTCGKANITSKFCPECGAAMPVVSAPASWNCTCGQSGITSNFCPNCGSRRPVINTTWNCTNCGQTGITTKFCPNCGTRKGE